MNFSKISMVQKCPSSNFNQPWFINAVIQVESVLAPEKLMKLLLKTEKEFGRIRGKINDPRVLDLDLIAYDKLAFSTKNKGAPALDIPHPRLQDRAFVLLPIKDVAPNWCHPVKNLNLKEMISRLPKEQKTLPLADANGFFGTEWRG